MLLVVMWDVSLIEHTSWVTQPLGKEEGWTESPELVEPNPKIMFVKVKQHPPSEAFCFARVNHCIYHSLTVTVRYAVEPSCGITSGMEK